MTKKYLSTENRKELISDLHGNYRDLVENLNSGVYRNTPGPRGHFLEVNFAMVKMFEAKSKKDLMSHNVSDLYQNPKERKLFVDDLIKRGEVRNKELNFITLKGRNFTGSVTAIAKKFPNGNIYFDGIIADVTRYKKMSQQLKDEKHALEKRVIERNVELHELARKQAKEIAIRSRVQDILLMSNEELEKTKEAMLNVMEDFEGARLIIEQEKTKDEAILASIGHGVIFVGPNMKVVYTNDSAAQMVGWKKGQMKNKIWDKIIKLKTNDGSIVPLDKAPLYLALHENRRITFTNFLYTRKDGTTFSVEITVSPVSVANETIGMVIVFKDTTKENEIDKAKSEFVSLASHQLRTPLGIMKWYLEAIMEDEYFKSSPKNVLVYFEEIQKSNDRVLHLVRDLLSVSRIDQKNVKNFPKQTDVTIVVKESIHQLQIVAKKKDVNLNLTVHNGDIPSIEIDGLRLREVIDNLIGNSLEYTPPGGLVEVTIQRIANQISISFKDTGIGISEGDRKNLFTKFFRSNEAIKYNPEGSGLGLYVVKSYVEGWGGKVIIDSVFGKGSTFTITLPIKIKNKRR